MEDIVKIQESFEELTREVEKFRSMSELAQSHQLNISEMSKQITKVIVNFEKYRNLLDGRIDRQSNLIESLLIELRNTQQGIGKTLEKFDATLGRNLKSIIDTSELQVTNGANNIIRAFTKGNDQTVSELVSIISTLDEIRILLVELRDNQSKDDEEIMELLEIVNKRQYKVFVLFWIFLIVLITAIGGISFLFYAK
jgi:hypothetical protein